MLDIKSVHGTLIKTNNYVISDNSYAVLIEASADLEDIKKEIGERKVLAILLTHGHWDHSIKLEKYLQEFKCKVYMTEEALKKINKAEKTFSADRKIEFIINKVDTIFVQDNDKLSFGENLEFKVIESKGHTDCSVSYLLNEKYLFSGDTIFKNSCGRYDLPTSSYDDLVFSLQKLLALSENIIIYPGHGGSTTIEKERVNYKF